MRQVRLALIAGAGVLVLCVIALAVSLADYTGHPEVANAHVPPVVGPAQADATSPDPSPVPTVPVTITSEPTPAPAAQPPDRTRTQLTFAQLLQQLEQRRHKPTPTPHR